jgi:hypothetical protein
MKSISRLKRAAVLVGVGALAIGGAVLGSSQAHAAPLGTALGQLSLTPSTGAVTGTTITYNSTACPAGFTGSAIVRIVDPGTGATLSLSTSNPSVASAFSGTLTANILATVETNPNFTDLATNGTEAEIAVLCASGSGLSGNAEYVQDSYLTFTNAGATYTETNTPPVGPPVAVTVAVAATPATVTAGQPVTLSATVTPSNATGTVQFENNGTVINTTGATITGGTASIPFTAPSVTASTVFTITAVYTPVGNFTAPTTPPTGTLTVNPAPPNSGTIPLVTVVPQSGSFTLTVDTADYVVLAPNTAATSATATTTPVVVADTRNTYPGWSVSGQATGWTGVTAGATGINGFPTVTGTIPADHGSQTIPADDLGWVPGNTGTLATGVVLGPTVAPGTTTTGLGDAAQVLASVHAGTGKGFGTTTLNAALTLNIPAGQEAGPYTAGLNITSVNALP